MQVHPESSIRKILSRLGSRKHFGLIAHRAVLACSVMVAGTVGSLSAQQEQFNYDEDKVGDFKIPDPLVMENGTPVATADDWINKRRPELLEIFAREVYGKTPATPADLKIESISGPVDSNALGGKATRKEVILRFTRGARKLDATLLLYIPKTDKPVPAFLGLNFNGNHAVSDEPGITLNPNWMRNNPKTGITDHRAGEQTRGSEASRWQVELLIDRGYALGTIYYGDFDPDYGENEKGYTDSWDNGLHPLFYTEGQSKPGPDEWGSIGAWSWGLSRALDHLEKEPAIDAKKVAVIGHSRLGKTSLWAGVQDTRFAMVVSNNSGCGGAALNKRIFGETVNRINTSFPHWFCDNFNKYNGHEELLMVDQHELLALVAPRLLYVASAVEDKWADPKGEYLAAFMADPVYRLLGTTGIKQAIPEMPPVDQAMIEGTIGYHIRTGEHDVKRYDWEQYLNFADKHLR